MTNEHELEYHGVGCKETCHHPDHHPKLAQAMANWPHDEPFSITDGHCDVCGYDYGYDVDAT